MYNNLPRTAAYSTSFFCKDNKNCIWFFAYQVF